MQGRVWRSVVSEDTATAIGVTESVDDAWGACKLRCVMRGDRWVTG